MAKRNLFLFLACLLSLRCGGSAEEQVANGNNEGRVEVFSWWTSGSEAAALKAIIEAYEEQYPETQIINASVAGGGGSAARPVLQTRLIGNNPPDTWQTHPGAELQGQYAAPGYTESLDDLYAEEGWHDVFPESLLDMVQHEGTPHMVILNLHRSNTLWYNKPLLENQGLYVGEELSHRRPLCHG